MLLTTAKLRRFFYSLNWDTRGRSLDVIRVLKPLLKEKSTLLDAGCGVFGLASFIPSIRVTGVDITDSMLHDINFTFVRGSIILLPFSDKSFSIATSVDVLEHLPPEIRQQAIAELIRVAQDAVILAFPCSAQGRQVDENFAVQLNQRNKPQPEWLEEHLHSPYPELDSVLSMIETEAVKHNKNLRIKTFYSEPIIVTRSLRWAAARSKFLYLAIGLLAGVMYPITPQTKKDNSYRVILLAEFF